MKLGPYEFNADSIWRTKTEATKARPVFHMPCGRRPWLTAVIFEHAFEYVAGSKRCLNS